MGSDSDLPVMQSAVDVLGDLGIAHEVRVTSAHRTPDEMLAYGKDAADRGLQVIIAGAGGAAHLPGMLASVTDLPVIGVPVRTSALSGMDSLLSIVQMPRGVPVATVAVDNATNAALLAARNQLAVAALREQADLLDLTHDTVFVRDRDDVIKYWNRAAEDLYGWSSDEAVGQPAAADDPVARVAEAAGRGAPAILARLRADSRPSTFAHGVLWPLATPRGLGLLGAARRARA